MSDPQRTWDAFELNLLGYPDGSDEPRIPAHQLQALGVDDDRAWAPLRGRSAQPGPGTRAALAGTALAALAAVVNPAELALAGVHLAHSPLSPLALTAVVLAAARIWRHR